jgi:hypothetical protein
VDGIFSLWSEPRPGRSPELSRLELVLLSLSVLEWRRWNGRAFLFCDHRYARYLERLKLIGLWDGVNEETIEYANSLDVNPQLFWTTGRLIAIANATIPFTSIDCDLIAWRTITTELAASEITFTHWESTEVSPWYPQPKDLNMPDAYHIDVWRDWSLKAANVSLAYFGSGVARDAYVNEALRFTVSNAAHPRAKLGILPELLFAEQRLLPLIAAELGIAARPVIDATWVPALGRFVEDDPRFGAWDPLRVVDQGTGITHAWFYKKLMATRRRRRLRFFSELTDRLRSDHPGTAEILGREGII